MTTLEIQLDDAAADAIRQEAHKAGMTPEAWAAEVLAQRVESPGNKEWITRFLESARQSSGSSGGKQWTRDELYDR